MMRNPPFDDAYFYQGNVWILGKSIPGSPNVVRRWDLHRDSCLKLWGWILSEVEPSMFYKPTSTRSPDWFIADTDIFMVLVSLTNTLKPSDYYSPSTVRSKYSTSTPTTFPSDTLASSLAALTMGASASKTL